MGLGIPDVTVQMGHFPGPLLHVQMEEPRVVAACLVKALSELASRLGN